MKQSLQIRLGQQITMTPQLQQAIRLLQLSTLDLQLEIQQMLESNIMIEVDDDDYEEVEVSDNENLATEGDGAAAEEDLIAQADPAENGSDEAATDFSNDIPEELAVDTNWDDIYDSGAGQSDHSNTDNNGKDLLNQGGSTETLRDHLMWQLGLTPFSDLDRAIATAIIDAIDGDGYLRATLEDIAQSLGDNIHVDVSEVETVLHRIQHFDPTGVGARSISECLLLQLAEMKTTTLWVKEAQELVSNHLELLAIHDYPQLSKLMGLNREDLREIVELIQSLNPRPGSKIESHQSTYIVPDVFVKKVKGQWKVELNGEVTPKLRINNYYAKLINRTDGRDMANLKNHLQEARWFIKSLKSRHETLLKVAKCIVKRQTAFLEYGPEAMKPLVLHDIASELEMHESTISRVTTQKYLHTTRGIFELKYFFSSHVNTDSGGECSSTAIRALIKKLISVENASKPLSDSKIAKLLSERGIQVARRTIAKYREAMAIPPSNERKRLT